MIQGAARNTGWLRGVVLTVLVQRRLSMKKEWSIEDVGELVAGLKLLKSPAEMASALGRDEQDVLDRMAQLGLEPPAMSRRQNDASKSRKRMAR